MKLNQKISLIAGLFTTTILLLLGLLVVQQWFSTLIGQLELTARDTAYIISEMEIVQTNLTRSNGSIPIQRRMEELRLSTRIQYIYVLDVNGLYYAHTEPGRIMTVGNDPFYRQIMDSEDPQPQVRQAGRSRLASVEAASPVFYQGELAGLVVAGLLNGRIYQEISLNVQTFCLIIILAVFISLYSSRYLAGSIKQSMQGLEPEEISRLLGQRAMTLDNLKEAIVTVDQDGKILYFNQAAEKLGGMKKTVLDSSVDAFYFGDSFRQCLKKNSPITTELKSPKGISLQCRFEPITSYLGSSVLGATALMEDLTTVRVRAEELTGIKQINEGLRAQNHEFLNKLHTISGLIQLEEYDEAIQYITGISHNRQAIIARLSENIKDPSVAGLLLGKYNKAQEQKTDFIIDNSCSLSSNTGMSETLNLILGNLIENALEELAEKPDGKVKVKICDSGGYLRLEIQDNGRGVPDPENVFEKGTSSKGQNRGLGLYLISEKVKNTDGNIRLESREGFTCFTVTLPRKEML